MELETKTRNESKKTPAIETYTESEVFDNKTLEELNDSFSEIKIKNVHKPKNTLPYLSSNRRGAERSRKKAFKNEKILAYLNLKDHNGGADNTNESSFKDDWSKQSCNEFFVPLESFLDFQLQREKSSKRRCKKIETLRNHENSRRYVEDKLKEYDDKICINVLLKQSKSMSLQASMATTNVGLTNYRALIAEEIIRKNSHCNRCEYRNRRHEENLFLNAVNFDYKASKNRSQPRRIIKLPALIRDTKVFNFQNTSSLQDQTQSSQQPSFLASLNQFSFRNLNTNENESSPKQFSSINNLLNESSAFSFNRKPTINKVPIEVQKRNLF